jgi:trans-aconitate 2-methyltransferase
MDWDPAQYAKFSDHRTRPALDLLARIPPLESVNAVVDLGCGTGNITEHIAQRWPTARITGVDGSREMLALAHARLPTVKWVNADLSQWSSTSGADIIYSNAALHWLPDHGSLFRHLARQLRAGGVLAVQMPRNFGAPTHVIANEIASRPQWSTKFAHLIKPAPVHEPAFYYDLMCDWFARVELWETEYIQVLNGPDPVLEWIKGSWLRQFLELLDADEIRAFERAYAGQVALAYPCRPDGTTILPFRRLFILGIGAVGSSRKAASSR